MPLLTGAELLAVTTIRGGDGEGDTVALYIPTGYVGPVAARLQDIWDRACWNWALCGSMQANQYAPTSPSTLYDRNAPVDPYTDVVRPALPIFFHTEPNLDALWEAARNALAGAAGDAHRIAFMTAMARAVARQNGLSPSAVPTPYKIHVTAPRRDWYHWQHWAVSFTHAGQIRFIQTEPLKDLIWGHTRLWEANRPGHIEASFYVQGLHQAHIDVVRCFLAMARCRTCNRVKPQTTTYSTRWHRCGNGHTFCGACGYALPWNGVFSRTRRCNVAMCGSTTAHLADP